MKLDEQYDWKCAKCRKRYRNRRLDRKLYGISFAFLGVALLIAGSLKGNGTTTISAYQGITMAFFGFVGICSGIVFSFMDRYTENNEGIDRKKWDAV